MTYSIVALDLATGQLGVAAQSRWFNVGSAVPWVEAGVRAVATQSFVEIAHGPNGLRLMRGGRSAAEALAEVVAGDTGEDVRQLGMVDAVGGSAAHTGACDTHAATRHGPTITEIHRVTLICRLRRAACASGSTAGRAVPLEARGAGLDEGAGAPRYLPRSCQDFPSVTTDGA